MSIFLASNVGYALPGQNAVTGERIRLLNPRAPKEEAGEYIEASFWEKCTKLKGRILKLLHFNCRSLANNDRLYQ